MEGEGVPGLVTFQRSIDRRYPVTMASRLMVPLVLLHFVAGAAAKPPGGADPLYVPPLCGLSCRASGRVALAGQ